MMIETIPVVTRSCAQAVAHCMDITASRPGWKVIHARVVMRVYGNMHIVRVTSVRS